MVNIEVSYKHGAIRSIKASGHADSAPAGHDLVCAAISAIILGGFNALRENKYRFEVHDGFGSVEVLRNPGTRDATVLETIVTQLESVAESHPDNASLERKHE